MPEEDFYPKVFQNNPQFYKEFLSRLDECVDSFIAITSKELQSHLESGDSTYYLFDLGGGTGETVIKLLNNLQKITKRPMKLDYLDPSKEMYDLFRKNVSEASFGKIVNDSFIEKWEKHQPKRKYDFIFACECWFGITNWEESLKKVQNVLKPNGIALIIIESKNSDFIKFKRKFLSELYENEDIVYGEKICRVLDKLEILYKKQTTINQKLDISDVVPDREGKISKKGRLFLSYLLRQDFDTVPRELQKEIKTYLINNYPKKIFILENDFIWIKK